MNIIGIDLFDQNVGMACPKNRLRWDCNTANYFLIKSITDPTFIVALNVCSYTLGFTKPWSIMLQATPADIIKGYNINLVKKQLQVLREDCYQVYIVRNNLS